MEINGRNIKVNQSELVGGECPMDVSWAASQIRRYGLKLAELSSKLAPFTRCVEVLEASGYTVEIIPDPPAPESNEDDG